MESSVNRRSYVAAVGGIGIAGIAGCLTGDGDDGGDDGGGSGGDDYDDVSIEIASTFEQDHVVTQAGQFFKEKIEEETDGAFSVTLTPGGAYGAEDEISEIVRDGGVDAHAGGMIPYSQYAPEYYFFGNAFVMEDHDHLVRVFESDLMEDGHQDIIDDGNQRPLGVPFYRGIRQYVSDFPVRHPDDIQNVDMRITEIESRVRIWTEIGVNSVPVAWPEVYTALQTGTVDTMAAPPGALTSISVHEVKDHLSMTNHTIETGLLYINEDVYQSLDETYQELVEEIADEATREAGDLAREEEQQHIDDLESNGMTVVPEDEVDREAFMDAAEPAIEALFEEEWVGTWDDVLSI